MIEASVHRETETITTQQTAMIIALAMREQGRGLGELLPLQVTKGFFKEILVIPRWQSFHQTNLNLLVQWGWLDEHIATHGTSFYSLLPAGRVAAQNIISRADSNCFTFVPQRRSLFDLTEEN